MNDYFNYLHNICESIPTYELLVASEELKKEVRDMNEKAHYFTPVFQDYFMHNACIELKGELAKYFSKEDLSQSRTIILSEELKIKHLWGEANNYLAIIKYISKSNIWHEFSHTIGLDDHYDLKSNNRAKSYCDLETCLMRYGNSTFEFCEKGKQEIRRLINKIVNIV